MHAVSDPLAHLSGVEQHLGLLLLKLPPDLLLQLFHALGREREAPWPKLKLEVVRKRHGFQFILMDSSSSWWVSVCPCSHLHLPGFLLTSLVDL